MSYPSTVEDAPHLGWTINVFEWRNAKYKLIWIERGIDDREEHSMLYKLLDRDSLHCFATFPQKVTVDTAVAMLNSIFDADAAGYHRGMMETMAIWNKQVVIDDEERIN